MASRLEFLELSRPDKAKIWLTAFGALARSKGWTDTDETETSAMNFKITDNFMATCGLTALEKIQFIVAPAAVDKMKFADIEIALQNYLKPKKRLTIAERTKFYSLKQNEGESVMDYMVRLRKGVQFCDFDKLKHSTDPTDEMLLVALVAGLHNKIVQDRVLDRIQSTDGGLKVDQVLQVVQQYEERQSFVQHDSTCSFGTIQKESMKFIIRAEVRI